MHACNSDVSSANSDVSNASSHKAVAHMLLSALDAKWMHGDEEERRDGQLLETLCCLLCICGFYSSQHTSYDPQTLKNNVEEPEPLHTCCLRLPGA
jgi:hypothetical protein